MLNSKRIPQVTKDLSRMGITDFEFNTQTPPQIKNHINATLSCTDNHLQIYRKALANGYQRICVFEDDVFVSSLNQNIFQEINDFLDTHVWDILYLGHFPWKIGKKVHKFIHESISWCTHAYIINEKTMRYMCKYTPQNMLDIGRLAVPYAFNMFFKEGGGIDTFLAYSASRNRIKSYAVVPLLVEQSSIKKWSLKAKIAEFLSYDAYWPSKVFYISWIFTWILLLLIIYSFRKNRKCI